MRTWSAAASSFAARHGGSNGAPVPVTCAPIMAPRGRAFGLRIGRQGRALPCNLTLRKPGPIFWRITWLGVTLQRRPAVGYRRHLHSRELDVRKDIVVMSASNP